MKKFIKNIGFFYTIILIISVLLYFFTKHNLILDYTAKKYTHAFSQNSLLVKHEIAEERRVVYQNIILNKNRHFRNLIIGSSRVMQFGKNTGFNNSLNLGVSGASLFDIKYIYNLTRNNNISYDTIIFDFNPWLVIKESDSRYKQFSYWHQIKYAISDIIKFNYNSEDLITIVGLFNNYKLSFEIASSNDIKNHTYFIKYTDGSIQQKKISHSARKNEIQTFIKNLYQMGTFYHIDQKLLNESIDIYNSASQNGKCLVTLTPFHMDLYKIHNNDIRIKNIIEVENILLASKRNFQIMGSFNPAKIKVNETDFLDGFHLKEQAIQKIFAN